MHDDVRRLFQSIGVGDPGYREISIAERGQSAAARWPLLAATNQLLAMRPPAVSGARPGGKRRRGVTVAVCSQRGGVGRTTLVANLTASLTQSGRRALAVDFDPQDALALHFGVEPGQAQGIATRELGPRQAQPWLLRFRGGPPCIPFGQPDPAALKLLESSLLADRDWLKGRLDELQPAETEFVLLDTPAGASPWTRQALDAADLVLVVLQADAASYATLPALEELLDSAPEARAHTRFLVNRFDERRELDRDVLAALRGYLAERALPFAMHDDDVVGEALARRHLITVEGGSSQVAADLRVLAGWAEASGDQLLELRPARGTVAAAAR